AYCASARHHRETPPKPVYVGIGARHAACTAASSALRNRERSCRVNGAGPPPPTPSSRTCRASSPPASALPILARVKDRPEGGTTRAPLARHRAASGMSLV